MKTLDETIKAFDDCNQWYEQNGNAYCEPKVFADALHYLREYRKLDSLDAVAFTEDDNDPLTWDELKLLKGKPVWVEEPSFFGKTWVIISGSNDEAIFGVAVGTMVFYTKDEQGKTWQAYRKERK